MYERLPGRGITMKGKSFLYVSDQHLLLLQENLVRQTYRRFAYSDIVSFQLHPNQRQRVALFGFGSVLVLFGVLIAVTPIEFKVVFAVLLALALVGFVMEILRGPRCRVWLSTAVGECELPSLGRVRLAERVLGRLISRVESAQGHLNPDQLRQLWPGRVGVQAP